MLLFNGGIYDYGLSNFCHKVIAFSTVLKFKIRNKGGKKKKRKCFVMSVIFGVVRLGIGVIQNVSLAIQFIK